MRPTTLSYSKGKIMTISKRDLEELNRLATNAYDGDKKFAQHIINEIRAMEKEITRLKLENSALKKTGK
jgi:hypothetical protein